MKVLSLHYEQKHLPLNVMKKSIYAPPEDTIPCPFIVSSTLRPCSKRFLIRSPEDVKYLAHHVFAHIPDMVPVKAQQFYELAANTYPVKGLRGCPFPFCNAENCGNSETLHRNHATELAVFILGFIAGPESILISSVLNLLVECRRSCLLNIMKKQVPLPIPEPQRISHHDSYNSKEYFKHTDSYETLGKEAMDNEKPLKTVEEATENVNLDLLIKTVPKHIEPEPEKQKNFPIDYEGYVKTSSVRLLDISYSRKWNKRVCRLWQQFILKQSDEYIRQHFNFIPSRPCKVANCDFRAHNSAALMKHIRSTHAK